MFTSYFKNLIKFVPFFFQLLRHQFLSDLVARVFLWRSVGSIKRREVYRRPINRLRVQNLVQRKTFP